jgi:glycogen operon protein
MLNAYWEPLAFELPPVPGEGRALWRRCVDTALQSPDDFRTLAQAPFVEQGTYPVQPRSVVVLILPLQSFDENRSLSTR